FLWSPSADAGLPGLPDSDWAFAALVVQPTEANIYIGLTNSGTITFAGVTNYFSHGNQAFSSATFVGTDGQDPLYSFNGAIDEVAIWKRALSSGELYTQFASAVGGVPATILTDLVGPSGPAAVGDPITLSVNAGGTPDLVYIWYKDSTPIVTITNNNKYTVANATFGDAGTYEVTVTNAFGSATSQQLAVTVVNPTQPTIVGLDGFFSRTLYPTGTLHMAVSAVGGGLTYQWYKNGTAIPAATESAYHVSLVTAADAGSYYVSVTNSAGATNTSSFPVAIAIATVTPGSYEAAIVASGPQAWWRLDETPGATNLIDSVGRHNGTYTNINGSGSLPALGVTGALVGNTNKAVSFDASGGIGLIPNSPQLSSGKFTVEAWVKTSVIQQRAAFSCVDNTLPDGTGWAWLANNANGNYWNPAGPDALNTYNDLENPSNYDPAVFGGYTSAAIGSNVWTHLVLQYDVDRLATTSPFPYTFFINGQGSPYVFRFVNNSAIYDKLSTTAPFVIGGYGDPVAIANLLFNGQVDEVAVYSRLITSAEITNHIVARGIEFFAPQFTAHPVAQTVTVGKRITFSASAQGNPAPVYQWFKGAAPITGATSNTFTIPSVTLADAGSYSLRATNQAGTNFSTAAVLTVLPATAYANVTNGLVLHLKFEGDVQDSSGKGNNGTPSSSPAPGFVAGKVGAQAAQFTTTLSGTTFSSASYVDLGTPTDLLFGSGTSFTVGLWVKLPTNGVPGDVPFIGTEVGAANNDGWFIGPSYQAGGWQWNLNDGTGNFGTEGPANSINDGNWHSFMVTVDRTSAVVNSYLDGLLVASTSISGLGSVDVGGTVTIAQDPSKTYPEAAVFTLDDIGIWRRALTPAEVATIESAGRAGNSFDTVAPPSVTLTISQTGGNIIVGYPSGTLQQSDSVGAGAIWTTVTGASAPSYTTSPTNAAKFYRVLLP
ncbi:MAG TPA: LamG-like jellyroll fold domain-containing protein, partial [Verrucomicrobiae bacterium]|nr:LamG-like jellyroll fold domain-containing protein [Verrucomicrobiae bacterium]